MTIRWGIIGCGSVTEVKSGPALQNADGSTLTAVMRRSAALAHDYADRHGVDKWYTCANTLINDEEVDAVYVATPPGNHMEYALKVCEAGKPCYVEKPMARNYAECRRMVEAFGVAGLPLFVAYYRRALPRFLKAKELIKAGRLGKVTRICYRYALDRVQTVDPDNPEWRLDATHSGGGIFLDLGCHTLDVLDFIFGPLQGISGTASNRLGLYDVEDGVTMRFETAGGSAGEAQWDFTAGHHEDLLTIIGTAGELSLSTFGNEPVRLETKDSGLILDLQNPEHIQQPLIQSVVNELRGNGTCPSTGTSAARTSRVMDEVLAGYYGGREDAFWERPGSWPGRSGRTQAPTRRK